MTTTDNPDDPEDDIPLSHLITRLTDNPLTQDAYLDLDTALPIKDNSDDWGAAIISQHTEQPQPDQPDRFLLLSKSHVVSDFLTRFRLW